MAAAAAVRAWHNPHWVQRFINTCADASGQPTRQPPPASSCNQCQFVLAMRRVASGALRPSPAGMDGPLLVSTFRLKVNICRTGWRRASSRLALRVSSHWRGWVVQAGLRQVRIAADGSQDLLKSCGNTACQLPIASIFWLCRNCVCKSARSMAPVSSRRPGLSRRADRIRAPTCTAIPSAADNQLTSATRSGAERALLQKQFLQSQKMRRSARWQRYCRLTSTTS